MNRITGLFGLSVVRTAHLDRVSASLDRLGPTGSEDDWSKVPASESIVDVQWLDDLRAKYQAHPLSGLQGGSWDALVADALPLADFRSDNDFVWQGRKFSPLHYVLTALYLQDRDSHGLFDVMDEDGAFGAEAIEFKGRLYTRDLLDSVTEIGFLLEHLPIADLGVLRIVDVGAGYGRLAHRLAAALPAADISCVDGIAASTAICDAYVRFRHLGPRVRVVPLTELDSIAGPISLATNVHSFSEMSHAAVEWWLDWLVQMHVEFLFIVPNKPGPSLNDGPSFRDLLDDRRFELHATRAKYEEPLMQRYGLYASDVYYLFRRGT